MPGHEELLAAAKRGRHIVWVCPPDPAYATPVWEAVRILLDEAASEKSISLIVTVDRSLAHSIASATDTQFLTGAARGAQLLRSSASRCFVCTITTALNLCRQSALDTDRIKQLVVGWPDALPDDQADQLDQLLSEVRNVPRYVLTADPDAISDLLDRQAHRALFVNEFPLPESAADVAVQFHLRGPDSPGHTVERILDQLNPKSWHVWRAGESVPDEAAEITLAIDLPPADVLIRLAAAGPTLVFVTTTQLSYLRRVVARVRPFHLIGRSDGAADWANSLQRLVSQTLSERDVTGELLILEPLFEQFHPAEVAAALLVAQREANRGSDAAVSATSGWGKVFIKTGRTDGIRPGDLVGALINEVGLTREQIGKIDLRDAHTTVEIASGVVDQTVQSLASVTLRGRRLQARRDRKGGA